jgi:hypothetical protein
MFMPMLSTATSSSEPAPEFHNTLDSVSERVARRPHPFPKVEKPSDADTMTLQQSNVTLTPADFPFQVATSADLPPMQQFYQQQVQQQLFQVQQQLGRLHQEQLMLQQQMVASAQPAMWPSPSPMCAINMATAQTPAANPFAPAGSVGPDQTMLFAAFLAAQHSLGLLPNSFIPNTSFAPSMPFPGSNLLPSSPFSTMMQTQLPRTKPSALPFEASTFPLSFQLDSAPMHRLSPLNIAPAQPAKRLSSALEMSSSEEEPAKRAQANEEATARTDRLPEPAHAKVHRGNLPREAKVLLVDWLRAHIDNPYPSEDEKLRLAARAGMSLAQVSYWFTNARRRYLPPRHKRKAGMTPHVFLQYPPLASSV